MATSTTLAQSHFRSATAFASVECPGLGELWLIKIDAKFYVVMETASKDADDEPVLRVIGESDAHYKAIRCMAHYLLASI